MSKKDMASYLGMWVNVLPKLLKPHINIPHIE